MAENNAAQSERAGRLDRRVAAWTRYLVIAPVLGLLLGAVTLVVMASLDAIHIVGQVIGADAALKVVVVEFIEIADIYLLAIVLYMIALGLFELFVDDGLPLPHWMEIHNLDDLKEKLVSVVIVVLGVSFLGKLMQATDYLQLMYMGVGIASVIVALTYFVGRVLGKKDESA